MARLPDLIQQRNADVRSDYERYRSGRTGRSARKERKLDPRKPPPSSDIINWLAEDFYLSERRVEAILWDSRTM